MRPAWVTRILSSQTTSRPFQSTDSRNREFHNKTLHYIANSKSYNFKKEFFERYPSLKGTINFCLRKGEAVILCEEKAYVELINEINRDYPEPNPSDSKASASASGAKNMGDIALLESILWKSVESEFKGKFCYSFPNASIKDEIWDALVRVLGNEALIKFGIEFEIFFEIFSDSSSDCMGSLSFNCVYITYKDPQKYDEFFSRIIEEVAVKGSKGQQWKKYFQDKFINHSTNTADATVAVGAKRKTQAPLAVSASAAKKHCSGLATASASASTASTGINMGDSLLQRPANSGVLPVVNGGLAALAECALKVAPSQLRQG